MAKFLNLATMATSQGLTITFEDYYGGATAANVGDVNGDDLSDFVIATSTYSHGSLCYIIYGFKGSIPASLESELSQTTGVAGVYTVISNAGLPSGAAGDVNKDGFDDIIISDEPNAYILYGNATLSSQTLIALSSAGQKGVYTYITGASGSSAFGVSVNCAGDINGDGFYDVLIGASQSYVGGDEFAGITYVIYGNSTLSNINVLNVANINSFGLTINGFAYATSIGTYVSGAGDVNKDGFDDMILEGNGYAYLVYGSSSLPSSIMLSYSGSPGIFTAIQVSSISQVSGAGDMNKDGFDDFMIGSTSTSAGIVYVYYGNYTLTNQNMLSTPTITDGFSIAGVISGSNTGKFVSNAGDVNQDGFNDIIIGANNYPSDSYVVYGNYSLSSITLNSFDGFIVNNTAHRENSVSGGGDFNGDGYPDLIIGTYGTSGGVVANTYLVYGAETGFIPYIYPTSQPSEQPTSQPTKQPYSHPTAQPSRQPTEQPSVQPSKQPSGQPSEQPYAHPTSQPSEQPTGQPTKQPLAHPTAQPTAQPSNQPFAHPTHKPTGQPSDQPTSNPSSQPTAIPTEISVVDSNGSGGNSGLSSGAIAGIAIVGLIASGGVGYCLYAYYNQIWPFITSASEEIAKNIDIELNPTDFIKTVTENPIVGQLPIETHL